VNSSPGPSLPADLQKTFKRVVNEQCAKYRAQCKVQEQASKDGALKMGVKFWNLSKGDLAKLKAEGDAVHKEFAKQIGPKYLAEVQKFLGYSK